LGDRILDLDDQASKKGERPLILEGPLVKAGMGTRGTSFGHAFLQREDGPATQTAENCSMSPSRKGDMVNASIIHMGQLFAIRFGDRQGAAVEPMASDTERRDIAADLASLRRASTRPGRHESAWEKPRLRISAFD
jgi:hypothetical protein